MKENKVYIVLSDTTVASGVQLGRETYQKHRRMIDIDEMNVIVFPDIITNVTNSFIHGFFAEIRTCMTPGEIKEHFRLESDRLGNEISTIFKHYISTI